MQRVQLLRIVVASPSDVQVERDIVIKVAVELNRGIARDLDFRLEVVQWETDAYPGLHPEGPQGLIDPILRIEDSDILIGIFWKRFGLPFKDAQSGTEHEFRTAYQAWKKKNGPQIMVYFNQRPFTLKSIGEVEQYGQVLQFREAFPKEGLMWDYDGPDEFEDLVRNHLAQFIHHRYEPLSQTSPKVIRNAEEVTRNAAAAAGTGIQVRLKRIELENIRCFEHINLNLCPGEHPAPWSLILGDNGVGKTTLLRSIALGLSPPNVARALFVDVEGRWVRYGAERGTIRLVLETGNGQEETIEVAIESTFDIEQIEYIRGSSNTPLWERLFVCGYGAARKAFGVKSYGDFSARDAVATLFDYDAKLQNPELILRRISSSFASDIDPLQWIDNILMLPPGSTRLGTSGLKVSGPWGTYTPIGSLGDGYQATLAWMLDFLGWAMYRDITMIKNGIHGIVLVDEIEQHLHPSWQRRILRRLHEQFPDVQFISTTHSPLCVIGTTDFEDDDISIIHLRRTHNHVEARSGLKPPRGFRADQVLTSYLFGLETTSDDQTRHEIERLSTLLSKEHRTSEEEEEIARLRAVLEEKLGSEETELERQVAQAIEQDMEARLDQRSESRKSGERATFPREAVDQEVKRQFRELFGNYDQD